MQFATITLEQANALHAQREELCVRRDAIQAQMNALSDEQSRVYDDISQITQLFYTEKCTHPVVRLRYYRNGHPNIAVVYICKYCTERIKVLPCGARIEDLAADDV